MSAEHETLQEQIDAWALGALDEAEARAIESHIADCDACSAIADAAQNAAASLAMAVPLISAPPDLKARIMTSAALPHQMPEAPASRTSTPWWQFAAAAVTIAGIGIISWGAVMQRQMNDLRATNDSLSVVATTQTNQFSTVHAEVSMASEKSASLAGQQDAMVEIVSQPDVKRVALTGTNMMPSATGRYVWSKAGELGVLVAKDLPPVAEGSKYCLWLVYESAWVVGGLFDIDESGVGRLVVSDVDDDPSHGAFRGFAVTIEPNEAPTGGRKHTGDTVLQSALN